MATQDQLNRALCNLCTINTKDNGIMHGILELLDIGADPTADSCKALHMAAMCENYEAIATLLSKNYFQDPILQTEFRKTGWLSRDKRVQQILREHNEFVIALHGWTDEPMMMPMPFFNELDQ